MKKYKAPPLPLGSFTFEPSSPDSLKNNAPGTAQPVDEAFPAAPFVPSSPPWERRPSPPRDTPAKKRKEPPNHALVFAYGKIAGPTSRKRGVPKQPMEPPDKRIKPPPAEWSYPQPKPAKRRRRRERNEGFGRTAVIAIDSVQQASSNRTVLPPDQLLQRQQPRSLDQVVGQKEAVAALRASLQGLDKGTACRPVVCMLVGPSGVGKSLCARLALQEVHRTIHEYAPDDYVDTRGGGYTVLSEQGIDEVLYKLAIRSMAFERFGILLDDVGSLKSDVQKSLVALLSGERYMKQFGAKRVKATQQAPILLTCDVADFARVSILARACQVIHMEHVPVAQLAALVERVCEAEGLQVSEAARDRLVQGCGGDVRRLLNSLHFMALHPTTDTDGGVDCSTMFYHEHSNVELMRMFVKQARTRPLDKLNDLMELHPVSLAMLMQENAPRCIASLEQLANCCEHMSQVEHMDAQVYTQHHWELQEAYTALSTWGASRHFAATDTRLHKSAYFGARQREQYCAKLIAGARGVNGRGAAFADEAQVWGNYVSHHSAKHPQSQWVERCKQHRVSYKDLQDVWRASHFDDSSMPNPRGNQSLRKLLQ